VSVVRITAAVLCWLLAAVVIGGIWDLRKQPRTNDRDAGLMWGTGFTAALLVGGVALL